MLQSGSGSFGSLTAQIAVCFRCLLMLPDTEEDAIGISVALDRAPPVVAKRNGAGTRFAVKPWLRITPTTLSSSIDPSRPPATLTNFFISDPPPEAAMRSCA